MTSIRDVAKMAGVASCTVSRVLNGSANVAPETKSKIERAIKELNYIPNELARGMFKQRSGTIAMLVPSIKHPFFSSLANNIEKELYKRGYKLMLCSTNDNINQEKDYLDILKSNIVDGVIMGVSNLPDREYEKFTNPLVMLDYRVNDDIPVVTSNHIQGGTLAAMRFIQSKCRYIIHIGNKESSKVESYKSHIALESELSKHGIKSKLIEVGWNEFDFEGYLNMAKDILSKNSEIDGIMAADLPASAFLKAAIKLGKDIPKDFCVISYDGTFINKVNIIDITTIAQSINEIGKKSVDILIDRINRVQSRSNSNVHLVDVSIIEGDTTK